MIGDAPLSTVVCTTIHSRFLRVNSASYAYDTVDINCYVRPTSEAFNLWSTAAVSSFRCERALSRARLCASRTAAVLSPSSLSCGRDMTNMSSSRSIPAEKGLGESALEAVVSPTDPNAAGADGGGASEGTGRDSPWPEEMQKAAEWGA